MSRGRMVLDDCLHMGDYLKSRQCNLIVTSPPYAGKRGNLYGTVSVDEYVYWFLRRSARFMEVLAADGSFVLNIKEGCVQGERQTYVLDLILALKAQGWRWVEEYVWHKTTSAPGKWPNRFRDAWEHLYHFTLSPQFKMRQEAVMVPARWVQDPDKLRPQDRVRRDSANQSGIGRNKSAWVGRDQVYPSNVLHGPPITVNKGHPAVFPDWLPEFFIKLFTDPGDLVLDPFAGSGTTLLVAERLGRRSLGFDTSEEYVMAFRERFDNRLPV